APHRAARWRSAWTSRRPRQRPPRPRSAPRTAVGAPTSTPTPTGTPRPTGTPTPSPTNTATPGPGTPTATRAPTFTPTPAAPATPTGTPAPATIQSFRINGGALTTTYTKVHLTLAATSVAGGVAEMSFSNDGSTWDAWQPYTTALVWLLPAGDGAKTVYARVRDQAGNVSAPASATIQLDSAVRRRSTVSLNQRGVVANEISR